VHVFSSEQREYYALERLWKDVPVIDVGLGDASGQATGTEETPGETDVR
ncbi:ribosome silencing factor, partial [Burkholderia multivorans]